ncbi:MAG: hypothetical protein IH602_19675 [Bryobacteraceae bacterium]|nr:hypothetical protein [Bryobacteraceae bacterium]
MPTNTPPNLEGLEKKKVLVGVRVPEQFHSRISFECLRREVSLQQLVMDALRFYFKAPLGVEAMTMTYFQPGQTESIKTEGTSRLNDPRTDVWLRYIQSMPREKVEVLTKAMEWDLQAQKSARSKAIKGKVKERKPKA